MCYDYRTLSLKVVMNRERTKVLFAEANSDFVDVLLSFLALPLGRVVKILDEAYGSAAVPGSLSTLYGGVSDLDEAYFSVPGAKNMLLDPLSSCRGELRKLALDISNSPPNMFFTCPEIDCPKPGKPNVSLYCDVATCDCGESLTELLIVDEHESAGAGAGAEAGAFTFSPMSFVITDDLRVAPIVSGGMIRTLSDLGITNTRGAEITLSSFCFSEMKKLLRYSLTSATPLTDLMLKRTARLSSAATKPEPGVPLHSVWRNFFRFRKMVLRVWLQKSTNKFLFVEATDDFVELLFSFLVVPLGGVEFLLGGNTGLVNIDNLYKSVANGIGKKYFTTPEARKRLVNPKLPYGYGSKKQFLPISEDSPPKLYYLERWSSSYYEVFGFNEKGGKLVSSFKSRKETYVKKRTMCFVKDNLSMSPSLATIVSILNESGIPPSDMKEVELQIGIEEALRILKASLTSKTVLTDALVEPMLNKLPIVENKSPEIPDIYLWFDLFFGFARFIAVKCLVLLFGCILVILLVICVSRSL